MKKEEAKSAMLIVGNVYFVVVYHNQSYSMPLIQTLIYEGKDTENGIIHLFKELNSEGESNYFVEDDDVEVLVYDRESLIKELQKGI